MDQLLQIPTLGRKGFSIGALYDCNKDCLLQSPSLWKKDLLQKNTLETKEKKINFDVAVAETLSQRTDILEVPESLKLSTVTALLPFSNSSKVLEYKQSSNKHSIFTASCTQIVNKKEIRQDFVTQKKISPPSSFKDCQATHFVVAIDEGFQSFITFETEKFSTSQKQEFMQKIQSQFRGEIQRDLEPFKERILKCTINSDVPILDKVSCLEEVIATLKSLPESLQNSKEKEQPIRAWLLPLSQVLEESQTFFDEIPFQFAQGFFKQLEVMEMMTSRSCDLQAISITQKFPTLENIIEEFKNLLNDISGALKDKINACLLKADKLNSLKSLLLEIKKSPAGERALEAWMKETEKQVEIVAKLVSTLTDGYQNNVKFCVSENELMSSIDNTEEAAVFLFDQINLNENFLTALQNFYSDTGSTTPTIKPYLKSSYNAVQKAKQFQEDANAFKDDPHKIFLIAENFFPNTEQDFGPIRTLYFQNGNMTNGKSFVPKAQALKVTDVLDTSAKLSWERPKNETSEKLNFEIQLSETSTQKKETFNTSENLLDLQNLDPMSHYKVILQAVDSGRKSAPLICEFFTLPTPPRNVKALSHQKNQIQVTWEPTKDHQDFHFICEMKKSENFEEVSHLITPSTIGSCEFNHEVPTISDIRIVAFSRCSSVESKRVPLHVEIDKDAFLISDTLERIDGILSSQDMLLLKTLNDMISLCTTVLEERELLVEKLDKKQEEQNFSQKLSKSHSFIILMQRWTSLFAFGTSSGKKIAQSQMIQILSPVPKTASPTDSTEMKILIQILNAKGDSPETVDAEVASGTHTEKEGGLLCQTVKLPGACTPSKDISDFDIHDFLVFLQSAGSKKMSLDLERLNEIIGFVLTNLEKRNRVSFCTVLGVLKPFGFDLSQRKFKILPDVMSVKNTLETFLNNPLKQNSETLESEIDIVTAPLSVSSTPQEALQQYLEHHKNSPSSADADLLQQYLSFCQEDNVDKVLEAIRTKEDITDFFLSEKKKNSELKKTLPAPRLKFTREQIYSISLSDTPDPKLQFLKNLLLLDYKCRLANSTEPSPTLHLIETSENDDIFSSTAQSDVCDTAPTQQENVSNADIVLEALSCCDDFLLQDVFQKMASCQLAIPIIMPTEKESKFCLWATRTIKKSWITYDVSGNQISHEGLVANKKIGLISFCRIGSISKSKSQLANSFISTAQGWPEHSYFLHRGIDQVSKFSSGTVEGIWFCPDGRKSEKLKDICCIYNLRGDARENKALFKFLATISSILIILQGNLELTKEEQDILKNSQSKVVIVCLEKEGQNARQRNISKIFSAGQDSIPRLSEILQQHVAFEEKKIFSLQEQAELATNFGIIVDESTDGCKKGKRFADEFLQSIQHFDVDSLKENVVPLQGKPWEEWAKIDKEEARQQLRGNTDPQDYSSQLREKKKEWRKQQCQQGPSEQIKKFLTEFTSLTDDESKRFFIDWVQLKLNEKSEVVLPKILKEYNSATKELDSLKKELEKSQHDQAITKKISEQKSMVKKLSNKFSTASFGIEHVFRELGQIYESNEKEGNLPGIMADLFLMGYALEIMDGDASHVPVKWVEAVFKAVKKKLKTEDRVYLLSILGIQSSGKSTLLNTLFAAKFTVSSGRCTRGVYLQMLPVAKEWREKLHCDYFFIMDSEGLRSPELSESFKHDNELATLVTCVANTTLINFWGQTFSKDMSDILQIAAHAYIRMKEVKIKSSFHLIFAGVPDVTAEERNCLGVTKIIDELNEMIQKIAKEEGALDIFSGLSSIFPLIQDQLTSQKIPQFLPALWQGNMRPPESRYGEIIQSLKESLCKGLQQQSPIRSQPLSEFQNRLKDIWKSIKQENFVFGFRNTQAIEEYSTLQRIYDRELTKIRSQFHCAFYKISEVILKEAKETNSEEHCKKMLADKLQADVVSQISDWKQRVVSELRSYISSLQDSDNAAPHLSSFEHDFDKKLNAWKENEQKMTNFKISSLCKKGKSALEKKNEYKRKCIQRGREVASRLKGDGNSVDVQAISDAFQNLFSEWKDKAKEEDEKLEEMKQNLFVEIWSETLNFLEEKLKLKFKNQAQMGQAISSCFETFKTFERGIIWNYAFDKNCIVKLKSSFSLGFSRDDKILNHAKTERNNIYIKVKDVVNQSRAKPFEEFNYTAVIAQVLEITSKEFAYQFSDGQSDYKFSKEYQSDCILRIYGWTVKQMAEIQEQKLQDCSIVASLKSDKDKLYQDFHNECTSADNDLRAAKRFSEKILLEIFTNEIKRTFETNVSDRLRSKFEFSSKNSLIFSVMQGLLSAPFDEITHFVGNYGLYLKKWMRKRAVMHFSKNQILERQLTTKIKSLIMRFSDAINSCSCGMSITWSEWWGTVKESLEKADFFFKISEDDVEFELHSAKDFQFMTDELRKILQNPEFQETALENIYLCATDKPPLQLSEEEKVLGILDWLVGTPLEGLEEQLVGCTAQCPFCSSVCVGGAACQNEDSQSQKHRAEIHMPQGMNGFTYHHNNRLCSNICTSSMASDNEFRLGPAKRDKYNISHSDFIPYKEVPKIITDWVIPPIPQADATAYWQYLFVKHQTQLASFHCALVANDIPEGWKKVTEDEALRNLQEMFSISTGNTEGESESSDGSCEICCDKNRDNICFYPCGHSKFCKPCATEIFQRKRQCPMCRAEIEKIQHLYN